MCVHTHTKWVCFGTELLDWVCFGTELLDWVGFGTELLDSCHTLNTLYVAHKHILHTLSFLLYWDGVFLTSL